MCTSHASCTSPERRAPQPHPSRCNGAGGLDTLLLKQAILSADEPTAPAEPALFSTSQWAVLTDAEHALYTSICKCRSREAHLDKCCAG